MKKVANTKLDWFERWERFLIPRMQKPGPIKYPYAILAWITLVIMYAPEYLFYRYNLMRERFKSKFLK